MANPIAISNIRNVYFRNGGSPDMDVNGSGTPVEFVLEGLENERLYLSQLNLYIEDSSNFDSGNFGGISGLTNGLQIVVDDGVLPVEILNIKDNAQIAAVFPVLQKDDALKNNDRQHMFASSNPSDAQVIVDDTIKVIIQDNLTGLDVLRISATVIIIPDGT